MPSDKIRPKSSLLQYFIESKTKSADSRLGIFGLLGGVGIMFATFVGGIVFDHIRQTAPFTMMGILNLALGLMALAVRIWGKSPEGSARS